MNQQTLQRTTFTTSRELEFFTEKELIMQIGHGKDKWPIALMKELIDNALDECEKINTPPQITISVTPTSFSVEDNGSGLTEDTINNSLDYTIRVSDKAYYNSPTRGALGNALKCIYAAPFVADGEGKIEIETRGKRYAINITIDRIAQKPVITLSQSDSERKNGVKITIFYHDSTGLLGVAKSEDFYKSSFTIVDLLSAYATLNPHANFTFEDKHFEATNTDWKKWNPSDPTSAHWYTTEQLRDLIAAYIGNNYDKTIREFVSEFRGLSGTKKQKRISDITELHGSLLEFNVNGDVDQNNVVRLLSTMKNESQPVKPQQLGVIGKEHLISSMEKYYQVKPESIQYKKVIGFDKNLPHVIEIAFGIKAKEYEQEGRTVICGLNWSPTLNIPITDFQQLLGEMRIDAGDPVCVIMHIARPKFDFVDRGKGAVHV